MQEEVDGFDRSFGDNIGSDARGTLDGNFSRTSLGRAEVQF